MYNCALMISKTLLNDKYASSFSAQMEKHDFYRAGKMYRILQNNEKNTGFYRKYRTAFGF
jgi:hypothetical protein